MGSVGFLLRATNRNPSKLLVVLLAIWVLSPYLALLWAYVNSKRWSVPTRVTLCGVMLVIALGSSVIYEADALWPRSSHGAFFFIVVPPASWLVSAAVVAVAGFTCRRPARRPDGV